MPDEGQITVSLLLEWGNGEQWNGEVNFLLDLIVKCFPRIIANYIFWLPTNDLGLNTVATLRFTGIILLYTVNVEAFAILNVFVYHDLLIKEF